MSIKDLQKELTWNFADNAKSKKIDQQIINDFAEKYKKYLDNCKTEREFVTYAKNIIGGYGYQAFEKSAFANNAKQSLPCLSMPASIIFSCTENSAYRQWEAPVRQFRL